MVEARSLHSRGTVCIAEAQSAYCRLGLPSKSGRLVCLHSGGLWRPGVPSLLQPFHDSTNSSTLDEQKQKYIQNIRILYIFLKLSEISVYLLCFLDQSRVIGHFFIKASIKFNSLLIVICSDKKLISIEDYPGVFFQFLYNIQRVQ